MPGRCINRNIVECKVARAIWNVVSVEVVLIETSWNVKIVSAASVILARIVLIETSWNVKAFRLNKRVETLGINRNIVECKERSD